MTGEGRAKKPAGCGRQRRRLETRWFYRGPGAARTPRSIAQLRAASRASE